MAHRAIKQSCQSLFIEFDVDLYGDVVEWSIGIVLSTKLYDNIHANRIVSQSLQAMQTPNFGSICLLTLH